MIFALIAQTKLVRPRDLQAMVPALQANAAHCAAAFMIDAPGIVVIDREDKLPKGCSPVLFIDGDEDGDTLAQHWWDPIRGIQAARVWVDRATGLRSGPHSVTESASHEIVEGMTDPYVNVWLPHPQRDGVEVAYECADMVQDTYLIDGWQVANFVTPHWYRRDLAGYPERVAQLKQGGFALDHADRLNYPGEVGPAGYVTLRRRKADGSWHVWAEISTGEALSATPAKAHPLARTTRRGVQFA